MGTDPVLVLVATALGGAISLGTTYVMARRAEKAHAHATARLLRDDLYGARAALTLALEQRRWWLGDFLLPTRSWLENRLPLAMFLSSPELWTLTTAFDILIETNTVWGPTLPRSDRKPLEDGPDRVRLEMALEAVDEALLVLAGFNWQRRLGLVAMRSHARARSRQKRALRVPDPPGE